MRSSMKYVIVLLTFSLLISGWATDNCEAASDRLQNKIDSLFVIASSGELRYRDLVAPAIDSLAAIGVEAVNPLIDKFTTKSARERLTVIQILKKIGSPAVPDLVAALSRSDGLVVQRVCWALGDIGDSAAVSPLIAVSGHSRWQVRDQAIGALGDIGDSRGADAAIIGLSDEIGQVRKAAAVTIGKLVVLEAIRKTVSVLGDEFYGARMSAMEALLKMDSSLVINVLADSLGSTNRLVGDLGCQMLGRIASDEALELLTTQLASTDAGRRSHAAVAIIIADPFDLCGLRQGLLLEETDRLTRVKIESAIKTVEAIENTEEKSQK